MEKDIPTAPVLSDKIQIETATEDFYRLLNDRGQDRVQSALEQLGTLIIERVQQSFMGSYYPQALG